jgi:hypothetical protein
MQCPADRVNSYLIVVDILRSRNPPLLPAAGKDLVLLTVAEKQLAENITTMECYTRSHSIPHPGRIATLINQSILDKMHLSVWQTANPKADIATAITREAAIAL